MADDPGAVVDCRAKDLELLESGNFADVEVVCGDRTWKCHRAILVPRSVWFQKALAGPFEEASTRRVNLDEENPICVDLALKYIYGNGLDVESSISPDHFIEDCVSLWSLADFLLLGPLKSPVEKAVHHYCDKWAKLIFTLGEKSNWRDRRGERNLTPQALDLISGVRQSYKWNIVYLKAILTEFIWVARHKTLTSGGASVLFSQLKDTPKFMDDLLGCYASSSWIDSAVWAANRREDTSARRKAFKCRGCLADITWESSEDKAGKLVNPFDPDSCNGFKTVWCRDCAKLDTIPWRK